MSTLTDSITAPVPNPMVVEHEGEQMGLGRRYTLGLMLFGVIVGLAIALMINA